ncbi:hypothetical protein STEG23_013782 [Scotinomys teguina]
MAPSLGEARLSIMRGILIAGVFAAFAITVTDSLDCRQCYSPTENCTTEATPCEDVSLSCVESLVNSTLGGSHYLYQNRSCSASNCSEINAQVAFTVHVFDDQRFHFASQCCQGEACNDTNQGTQNLTNTECPACYSYNTTTCQQKTQQCFQGEQCVHIIAHFLNGFTEVAMAWSSSLKSLLTVFVFTILAVLVSSVVSLPPAEANGVQCLAYYGEPGMLSIPSLLNCTGNETKCGLVIGTEPRPSPQPNGVECFACYDEDGTCKPVFLECTGVETKCIDVVGTGSISNLLGIMGIPKDGLQNLANTLEGDKELNSPRELSAKAEKELAIAEKTIREAHVDRVNPELKCILIILRSGHPPTEILMQREDIILE